MGAQMCTVTLLRRANAENSMPFGLSHTRAIDNLAGAPMYGLGEGAPLPYPYFCHSFPPRKNSCMGNKSLTHRLDDWLATLYVHDVPRTR